MALSCMLQHLQKHLWTCLVFRVYTVVTQFLEHSAMKCTKIYNSINELQNARASQPVKSPLFLSGASFAPTEELLASASLTHLLPPLLCPWGRLCNTVPSSSFFQTTKTLSYFIFLPLHLNGAITLPYSAYDLGAIGGGTHWPRMIMSFQIAEICELHFSAGGFDVIWYCCSTAEWKRVVLLLKQCYMLFLH